jgi:hypothetical protein
VKGDELQYRQPRSRGVPLVRIPREMQPEQPFSTRYLVLINLMNRLGKNFYFGSVPHKVKARRRAKNRVAKQSRKRNR